VDDQPEPLLKAVSAEKKPMSFLCFMEVRGSYYKVVVFLEYNGLLKDKEHPSTQGSNVSLYNVLFKSSFELFTI